MAELTDWQEEVLRQGKRLEADLVGRQGGVLLTCILFGFFLPFWLMFLIYVGSVLTEILQAKLLNAFGQTATRGRYFAILGNSFAGLALFSLPPMLLWQMEDLLISFTGMLALIGALLNVSVLRSTHLPIGIASGLPPAAALFWLPAHHVTDFEYRYHAMLAAAGVVILLAYFAFALVQNNRVQKDLLAAARRDRQASRDRTELLRTLGHEIRTPLNGILGHGQLLAGASLKAESRAHLEMIDRAAHNMQTLVEDVLDLASVVEDDVKFRPVTAVIRRELNLLKCPDRYGARFDADQVEIDIADNVPNIGRFDPLLLRKCLVGLASIALSDLGEAGASRLSIRCALAPGRDDRLRFTLTAGHTASDGGSAARDATGAALDWPTGKIRARDSLSRSLVEGLANVIGARVNVLRVPDNSLVTRIELPFVTVPEPPPTGAEQLYGRLSALVVDDIASNRFMLTQMLRSLRIDAVEVASGHDALLRLEEQEFDFVLLDMNMPDMDGETTFAAIRAAPAVWADLPVIAVTADAPAQDRERYTGIGIDGYVAKPVDRNVLWAEILSTVPPPPPL